MPPDLSYGYIAGPTSEHEETPGTALGSGDRWRQGRQIVLVTALIKIVLILIVVAVGFIGFWRRKELHAWFTKFLEIVRGLGIWGPLLLTVIYAVLIALLLPSEIMLPMPVHPVQIGTLDVAFGINALSLQMVAAGFIFTRPDTFGANWGLLVSASSCFAAMFLSAFIDFYLSRWFLRASVDRYASAITLLQAVKNAIEEGGFKVIALFRLTPFIPFAHRMYGLWTLHLVFPFRFRVSNLTNTAEWLVGKLANPSAATLKNNYGDDAADDVFILCVLVAVIVLTVYAGSCLQDLGDMDEDWQWNPVRITILVIGVVGTLVAMGYTGWLTSVHYDRITAAAEHRPEGDRLLVVGDLPVSRKATEEPLIQGADSQGTSPTPHVYPTVIKRKNEAPTNADGPTIDTMRDLISTPSGGRRPLGPAGSGLVNGPDGSKRAPAFMNVTPTSVASHNAPTTASTPPLWFSPVVDQDKQSVFRSISNLEKGIELPINDSENQLIETNEMSPTV